jgi:hypothetical protein
MSNDYVHAFKQSTLYRQHLQGGRTGHEPNKTELLLRRAQGSSDLAKIVVIVANYTFGSSFTNRLSHLKRKKMFRFAKRPIDCPPSIDEDSHHLDHVNFFLPWVYVRIIEPDIVQDVHIQQLPSSSNDLLPLLS